MRVKKGGEQKQLIKAKKSRQLKVVKKKVVSKQKKNKTPKRKPKKKIHKKRVHFDLIDTIEDIHQDESVWGRNLIPVY